MQQHVIRISMELGAACTSDFGRHDAMHYAYMLLSAMVDYDAQGPVCRP